MKTLLKIVLPILLLSFVTTSCATTVAAGPSGPVVVAKLHQPRIVVHKNIRYYRSGGMWYIKKRRGYVKVSAPVGVRISALPRGYKVVTIRGAKYYKYRGVYYKRSGRKYIIVNV